MEEFPKFEAKVYENGARHVYEVDADGKHTPISGDAVMEAYGYEVGQPADGSYTAVEAPIEVAAVTPEDTESSDQSLYDEYATAVKDESATIRIKNDETGKMEATKVKDLNFREWVKATESRKAAKWYSETRAHGEVPEGELGDLGNGDAAGALADRNAAEWSNEKEGKDNPTQADIDYYRWLKNSSGKKSEETETPETPEPEDPDTEVLPPVDPLFELPPEMAERLSKARDEYIKLNAKRRGLVIGLRNRSKLKKARAEYEAARDEAGQLVAQELKNAGATDAEIKGLAAGGAAAEIFDVSAKIRDEQIKLTDGKRFNWFYSKWARHGGSLKTWAGIKGAGWKMAVLAVPTAIIAVPAGAVGAAFLGPIAGVLVGAGIGRGVARGMLGAKINKEAAAVSDLEKVGDPDPEPNTVAGIQRETQRDKVVDFMTNSEVGVPETAYVTDIIEDLTKRNVRRNRRRAAVSIGAAAATGAIGGAVAASLTGHSIMPGGGGHHTPTGGGGETPPPAPIPVNEHHVIDVIQPKAPAPSAPHIELVPTDGRFPWTHMSEQVGAGEATPTILALAAKGKQLGFEFHGQSVPGVNNDVITGVTTPDGVLHNDMGWVNAALDYLRNN